MRKVTSKDETSNIIIIGSLGWEHAIRLPFSFTPGAFMQSLFIHERPGGTGLNLALGLSSAGVSTRLIGSVGSDELGNRLRDHLILSEVKCDLQILPTETTRSIILIEPTGERTIIGLTPDLLNLTDISSLDLSDVRTVVFPSWRQRFGIALNRVRKAGCATIVGLRALADPELPEADLAVGSRYELGSIEDPSLYLNRFKIIVVTEGIKGSRVYHKHGSFNQPALPADTIDSTGAGDAYMAGFIVSWDRGEAVESCALTGSAWGATAVECEGALPPPWNEVDERLKKYIDK